MLLAEALAERADIQARLSSLKQRAEQGARFQEGDAPVEDVPTLLAEADRLHARLQELMWRINVTNSTTAFDKSRTITQAIAERDVLARRRATELG